MTSVRRDDSVPPALFDHCCTLYRAMLAEAVRVLPAPTGSSESHLEVPVQESSSTSPSQVRGAIVYRGFLTKLVTQELHLSVPYYTKALSALKVMGCIKQLKRGGGTAPSEWELFYEPTYEAFVRQQPTKVPAQTKDSQTDGRIDALSARVRLIETQQEQILYLLSELMGVEEEDEEQDNGND